MRIQFAGATPIPVDVQPQQLYVGPKTLFEMVLFSVTVSIATQLIMRALFKPRT